MAINRRCVLVLALLSTPTVAWGAEPAEPVLCSALTNQDADIRAWSIDAVLDVTADVGVYISRIKPLLHDPDAGVRGAAVEAMVVAADAAGIVATAEIAGKSERYSGSKASNRTRPSSQRAAELPSQSRTWYLCA